VLKCTASTALVVYTVLNQKSSVRLAKDMFRLCVGLGKNVRLAKDMFRLCVGLGKNVRLAKDMFRLGICEVLKCLG
jgi:hypothetical protein